VIDPKREVRATNDSAAANLGNRRIRPDTATTGRLEPDATLVGMDSRGRRTAVMMEYDRTRRPAKQRQKLRRYDRFLTAGWRDTRYAELDMEPAVIFVCANDAQIAAFVQDADKCLTAWHADPAAPRSAGEHVGREQIAITSRSRLVRSRLARISGSATSPARQERVEDEISERQSDRHHPIPVYQVEPRCHEDAPEAPPRGFWLFGGGPRVHSWASCEQKSPPAYRIVAVREVPS
jgi:hypothetical protein